MHISVTCPRCQTQYQLDPGLRGKMMRCPNNLCRQVFEVKDGEPPPPTPPEVPKAPSAVTGGVGDVVPMLSAEAITQEAPAPAQAPKEEKPPARTAPVVAPPVRTAPSTPVANAPGSPKQQAPPRRERTPKPAPAEERSSDSLLALEAALSESGEMPVTDERIKSWEPPPVRGGRTSTLQAPTIGASVAIQPENIAGRRKRRIGRAVILLIGLLIASGGGFFYLSRGRQASHEAEYMLKAEKLYEEREFGDAAQLLQKLHRQFPESPDIKHYRFLAELSDVREAVYHPRGDVDEAAKTHDRLRQFLVVYQSDPLLEKYKKDIEHSLLRVGEELVSLASQKQERALLQRAQNALAQAEQFKTTSGPAMDLRRKIESEMPRVETVIAEYEKRRGVVEGLQKLAEQPSSFAVRTARTLVQLSGMQGDAEVAKLLEGLVTAHAASVTYTPSFRKARTPPFDEADFRGAFVVPLLGKMQAAPIAEADVIVSLARGVLYALDARTGSLAWARRVGADTTVPPLRLPATPISPSCYLVTSTGPNALTAVEAEHGTILWQQSLEDAPVGTPVLVGKHAFVATASGKVLEIEATEGTLVGYFTLGQALSVGGVHEPGSNRVYFAANHFSVFILNVGQRTCSGLLYAGHEAGSLKCEPFVLLDPDPAPTKEGTPGTTGWLVLTDVANHDSKFRVFSLPIQHPDQTPLPLDVKAKGWARLGPVHDRQRVALATDAGHFGVWGVRQKGTRDPVLFPLVGSEFVFSKSGHGGAAAVAHSHEDDFWVMSGERLQLLSRKFSPDAAPSFKAQWRDTPHLGNPVHRVETRVSRGGRTILYITAQAADSPACFVTAVDADDGSLFWRRQLGVVGLTEPIAAGDGVWIWDAGGVMRVRHEKSEFALQTAEDERAHLLSHEGDPRAVAIIEGGKKLSVQIVDLTAGAKKTLALPSPFAGTAAMGKDAVVLPGSDGILTRLPLGDGVPAQGPHWRGAGADHRRPGHVVAMGDDSFVVTDGGNGVQIVHWANPKVWESRATIQLPRRLVAPPAVIAGMAPRIVVADSGDSVTLLGERLSIIRQWPLGAKVTEGPFVRGAGIGCVVAGNRLVWLDPDKAVPVWEYTFVAPIVGQPRLIHGHLIVADLGGNIIALDPASGEEIGEGYTLSADVAPAAAPVAFGKDQIFLPLTDGTMLFLPVTAVTGD